MVAPQAGSQRTNKSAELVKQLRQRFLEEYKQNEDEDLYDPRDLAMIEDDWYLKRFLLAKKRNLDDAFQMLVDAMRWRCSYYVSETCDFHFPSEFYAAGALFPYEKDKGGNVVLYMRIKMHKKVPELDEPTKGFLVHQFNKAEKISKGQGFAIVFDLEGAGLGQVDLPFLTFLIDFGKNFFPGALSYILIYNLPWILGAFQKVAFSMLPQEFLGIIKFARGKEIFDYVAPECVPDYISGGSCKRDYRAVPPGARSIDTLMQAYGYSQDDYDRIFPKFKKDLEEGVEAVASGRYEPPPPGYWDSIEGVEITPLPLPSQRVRTPRVKGSGSEAARSEGGPLSLFPSDKVVRFLVDGSGGVSGDLDITNNSESPVAFKVQSNSPASYFVSPRLGILLPKASLRVTISSKRGTVQDNFSKDKFLVVGLVIEETKLPARQFSRLWLDRRQDIVSHKLSAALVVAEEVEDEPDSSSSSNLSSELSSLSRKCSKLAATQRRLTVLVTLLTLLVIALLLVIVADEFYGLSAMDMFAMVSGSERPSLATRGPLGHSTRVSGKK